LEHWTWTVGSKFSSSDRAAINLTRHYSLQQVEYGRNLIVRRHWPIHERFERSCDIGLLRLTPDTITQIFGLRTSLEHLAAVRQTLAAVTDRFAAFEAVALDVQIDTHP
jgi:hypothetical protein